VKRLIVLVFLCALWPLAACGGGDGTLDSCASTYTGTFTGMDGEGNPSNGRILATLTGVYINEAGEEAGPVFDYQFIFDSKMDTPTASNSESIMGDGTLVMAGSGLRLTGTIDLETCEGSGQWVANAFLGMGEWRISSGHAAW
jgi:hypothetical protein